MKPTEYLTITERPNTSITVMSDSCGPLIVASDGPGARAVRYTPEESAKFALAILEAAGVEGSSTGGLITGARIAVGDLKRHVAKQECATAEAKEQAEFEAEALELFNAFWTGRDEFPIDSWDDEPGNAKQSWLAVARRAREMAKEATK